MKKIYGILLMAVIAVALSGCDENDRYDSLLGRWERVALRIDGYESSIRSGEWEQYIFFEDGTGIYSNDYESYDLYWDTYNHDRIHIRYSDGMVDDLYYEVHGNTLELSPTTSFRDASIYRYTGSY